MVFFAILGVAGALAGEGDANVLRRLTTEDGLPQNWVRTLLQDDDHMLWIGTSSGLMRYDGVELSPVEPVLGVSVEQMIRDPQGTVWINTDAALWRREGADLTLVEEHGPGRMPFLVGDTEGEVWLQRGARLVQVSGPPAELPLPEPCQQALLMPVNGSFRCQSADTQRMYRLVDGAIELIRLSDGSPLVGKVAFEDSRAGLWVPSEAGLVRFTRDLSGYRAVPFPEGEGFLGGAMLELRSGEVWLSNAAGEVYAWDGEALRHHASLQRPVTQMLEDSAGTVWAGTNGDGLYQLAARRSFSVFDEGLPDPMAWTLYDAPDGARWIATETGLVRQDGEEARVFTMADGLPSDTVYAIYADPSSDRLWLGAERGLAWWDGEAIQEVPAKLSARGGLLRDRRGVLWVGGAWGLWRTDAGGELTEAAVPVDISSTYPAVGGIAEDAGGRVWFATSAGLLSYDGAAWVVLAEGQFRGLSIDDEGAVWATLHGGGLLRVKDGQQRLLSPEQGLPASTLHAVAFDDVGFVWLSSNRGLFRVRQESLREAMDQPAGTVRLQAFGVADGLRSLEFNSGFPPFSRVGGELWFPSTDGFVRADPSQVARGAVAPVPRIRTVQIDSVEVAPEAWGGLALSPQTRALSIGWSAPDLLNGRGVAYRYQLVGHDDDWLEAGGRRQATWSNLPPGEYTFRLQATNTDGIRSAQDATLAFTVEARLYQRPWFLSLLALLGAGLAYGAHRYRLRILREQELAVLVEQRTADLQAARAHSEQQARELERLNAIKTRFFANVSHELRTPLSLIVGPVEGAIDDGQPIAGTELQRLSRSARRLRGLIDELLDIARLDAGQLPLYAAEGDLAALLEARAALFRPLASRQGVQIAVSAEPLVAWFDRERLQKVLDNLISNALRYTDDGGVVTLALAREDGRAVVSVADDGAGIAPEHLPHIFERFYQAPEPGGRPSGSSGIGLSFCQELVARHGGTLTAQSTPGEGSCFTISLPLGRAHLSEADIVSVAEAAPTTSALPEPVKGEATVLIVEDSADMRAWLRQVLAKRFAVIEAADGTAGLELARELIPDVVVSDVMMPGTDGLSLVRALRGDARTSHLPVILLSARTSGESRLEGLEHGADAYLGKPLRPRELMVVVDNLLRARESLQTRHRQDLLMEAAQVEVPSADTVFLRKVRDACEANIESDGFGVNELAGLMSMSRRQLGRKISSLTGEPPSALIRRIRLHRARALLEQGAGNVSEIAYRVGYSKPSRFTAHFRAEFGVTPSSVLRG